MPTDSSKSMALDRNVHCQSNKDVINTSNSRKDIIFILIVILACFITNLVQAYYYGKETEKRAFKVSITSYR